MICQYGRYFCSNDGPFLYKSRVWYLQPTPSVCPGCARGCTVDIWHRKAEWKLNALEPAKNVRIERVTPRENSEVNGPWICNKGRDLAQIFQPTKKTVKSYAAVGPNSYAVSAIETFNGVMSDLPPAERRCDGTR